MSYLSRNRGLVAGLLIVVAWLWTAARVAAFQVRTEAEKALWSGRLDEALQKYRLLELFSPSGRKARAGQLEVLLGLMERQRPGVENRALSEKAVRISLQNSIREQIQAEPLRSETWSTLADVYAVVKPGNQALRTYSLEEIARPAEDRLEIEDLLRIRALEVSLELDPNSVYHRDSLADLAGQLGLREFAMQQYGEALTIHPDPFDHLFLASDEAREEMTELVIQALHRAVQPPRNARKEPVYRHLGMFLLERGRYQEAYDAFQKCQDASGRSAAGLKALARSGQGRLDDAIALYREEMVAEGVEPENRFYILANLGGLLEQRGRYREASEAFQYALVIRPHDPGTLLQLGRVYESMGLWQDAEDCYVRASEIGSERITNLAQLVLFYRRIGKPALALAPARKLLSLQPEEPLYQTQIKELEAEIESKGR